MVKRSSIRRKWKIQEQRIAEKFGTRRTPLSGSNSGHDTTSDTLHKRLYIEVKHRKHMYPLKLLSEIAPKARAEGKIPVLALKSSDVADDVFLIRSKDLEIIARELKLSSFD